MPIEGLKKYRHRPSIEDLPEPFRSDAWEWYYRILRKRQSLGKPKVEPWLRAILMGQAKRLAHTTLEERRAWGHRMLARHGGLAVQRTYRGQGRDTLTRARYIRQLKQQERKRIAAENARREQLGLPPPRRWKRLPIG